jgi:hypothetical protein
MYGMPRAQDAQDAYREVGGRKRLEHVFERRVIGDYVQDVRYAAGAGRAGAAGNW